MAKRIGVLEADQRAGDFPRMFIKKSVAVIAVRRVEAVWIVKNRTIQKLLVKSIPAAAIATAFWDGPLGVGNALPFSRQQNKFMAPTKLHYETPCAGDVGFWRHYRPRIRVSSRKIAFECAMRLRSCAQA